VQRDVRDEVVQLADASSRLAGGVFQRESRQRRGGLHKGELSCVEGASRVGAEDLQHPGHVVSEPHGHEERAPGAVLLEAQEGCPDQVPGGQVVQGDGAPRQRVGDATGVVDGVQQPFEWRRLPV